LPKAIQSGQTPQQAADAVRGMSGAGEGLKQLTQTLMQQLFEGRRVPMADLDNSAQANPRNDVGVSIEALGVSSGVAFNVSAANNGSLPVRLQGEGIVVEPVTGPPSISRSAATPQVTVEPVEAFCLERTRPVAPPGTQYRVAPPAVQAQHHRMLDILHAAERVNSAGLLRPDSEVKSYFNFVRQWSIWSKQENFDEKTFTEQFLNQTKKNVEARQIKWTDDMKNTVRKAAPGRWRDINSVLNEANQPKIQASANRQGAPIHKSVSAAPLIERGLTLLSQRLPSPACADAPRPSSSWWPCPLIPKRVHLQGAGVPAPS